MKFLLISLCFLQAVCFSFAYAVDLGSSGYVDVKNDSRIFYWFFPAMNSSKSFTETPLVMFVQGGPGCAGSLMFQLYEGGRYNVMSNLSLSPNKYTWNRDYHILTFDAPVGTGFSYSPSGNKALVRTNRAAAEQIYEALSVFLHTKQPTLKGAPFYLSGESYAGIYIPYVATFLLDKPNGLVDFRGIAIGNPWSDPATQVAAYADYLMNTGLIGLKEQEEGRAQQTTILATLAEGNATGAGALLDAYVKKLFVESGMPDPADVRYYGFDRLNFTAGMDFLNLASTRARLGVGSRTIEASCAPDVAAALADDHMDSTKRFMKRLLGEIDVLIFNGNFDFTCPTPGVANFVRSIQWKHGDDFFNAPRVVWRDEQGQVNGYWKHYDRLTFVVVAQAGHMAIEDQPKRSLDMLNMWINRENP